MKFRKLYALLALFVLFGGAPAAFAQGGGQLEITFFNVGAGDCILLRQGEHSMMIDTGYEATEPAVAASLDAMGVKSLDCLLLTHYDEDHVGGAPGLLASFDVGEVYGPDYRGKSREYQNYEAALKTSGVRSTILKKEASFTVGSLDVVLYPPQKRPGMVPNEYSVFCSVTFGSRRFLFTGDALDQRMTDFASALDGRCDFIKLPHHGMFLAKSAIFRRLLSLAKPKYGVITNSPQFPITSDLALMLEIYRLQTLETKNGYIVVKSDGDSIEMYQPEAVSGDVPTEEEQ